MRDSAADRHPVVDVVGDQRQPVAVAPRIEQRRLGVEELLDLVLQQRALARVRGGASLAAAVRAFQRRHQTAPVGGGEWVAFSSAQSRAAIHSVQAR